MVQVPKNIKNNEIRMKALNTFDLIAIQIHSWYIFW